MAGFAGPQASIDDRQNAPLGIGLMVLGFFLFSANDALGKWMAVTYSAGQILLFRSAVSAIILVPFVLRAGVGSLFRLDRPWLHVARMFFATAEVFCFYLAVRGLALADIMTYYLAGPIYVTVLAALVLKERVGWRRWTAVGVGFLGVLIALKPSTGVFSHYALIALLGSVLYAFFLVSTRQLRVASDLSMATWQVVASLIAGAVIAPFQWVPIGGGTDFTLLGLLGIASLAAIVCVNRSLKLAPASVVVPYQYTLIIWAVAFGYFVFDEVPSWRVLLGASVIVGAGLYIFFREQVVVGEPMKQVAPGP